MRTPSLDTPHDRAAAAAHFVDAIVAELEPMQRAHNEAQWRASVTGSAADADERARLDARLRTACARPERLALVERMLEAGGVEDAVRSRELVVLRDLFRAHQMPAATIERMVELEKGLDATFNNYRAEWDGRRWTDNELREVLQRSDDVTQRRGAWEAFKQIGAQVTRPLLDLVRLRNQAARDLGYPHYYSMMLSLDELDEAELFAMLDDVERGTRPPFEAYRADLGRRLQARFGVAPEDVRPWHLADPFFQEAPATDLDLDRHYHGHDLERMADAFFAAIGLPLDDLLPRADLYERPGKSQHAFCLSVDRRRDVRVLCNVRPNEFWMSVLLHEFGHAVYDVAVNPSLPWLLRMPAHTLTTEASAMLFGRLSKNAAWLERWAGVPADEAARVGARARQAVRDQLLVQTRWTLVMCHMEHALYADPDQDLDGLWWDLVERFQRVRRPDGRHAPDWASKIHFSAAPVYYHNYLLGEIMASQLWAAALRETGGGWPHLVSTPDLGRFLTQRLYAIGKTVDWRGAIHHATGSALSPDAYVADLAARD